jgi:hypothetical protein
MIRTIKEFVRHGITRLGLNRTYVAFRRARGVRVEHLLEPSLAGRFDKIYEQGIWKSHPVTGSRSGVGSDPANTLTVQEKLPELLATLGTSILLDIGCGDFGWMRDITLPCRYVGIDIVRSLIEENQAFATPTRSFLFLDATVDPLPSGDTLLCREILFHLSFEDIWRLVGNCRRSGARFLIATSDAAIRYNADIISGDFRLLNLREGPFRFPSPVLSILDDRVSPGRTLGVWKISDLPRSRFD